MYFIPNIYSNKITCNDILIYYSHGGCKVSTYRKLVLYNSVDRLIGCDFK